MSTYLVAFIISDYKNSTINASATNPTQQSIFAPEEMLHQAQYGLHEGVALLNAIEKYLKVPYGLTKIDQAAIPNFAAGMNLIFDPCTFQIGNLIELIKSLNSIFYSPDIYCIPSFAYDSLWLRSDGKLGPGYIQIREFAIRSIRSYRITAALIDYYGIARVWASMVWQLGVACLVVLHLVE